MKKRLIATMLTGFAAVATMLGSATKSFAYDKERWLYEENSEIMADEDGEEYWYLDGKIHEGCTAELGMYIYVDNTAQGLYDSVYERNYYVFDCYTNVPEEDIAAGRNYIHLCKEISLLGINPCAELEYGNVYFYSETIEPGDYTFCFPNAEGSNGIMALSRDYKSCMVGSSNSYYTEADAEQKNYEVVHVPDKDGTNVYMYFGGEDWARRPEVIAEYAEWAEENYETWLQKTADFYSIPENVSKMPDEVREMLGDRIKTADPTPTPVPTEDTFVPSEEDTRVVSVSNDIVDESELGTETPEGEEKSGFGKFGIIAIIAAIVGVVVVVRKLL